MTPPLPDRIAAAIDRYGIYTHDDTTRGLTIPCARTLAARDELIALFAEVVAERDAANEKVVGLTESLDSCTDEIDEVASALGRWKPLRDSVGAAANEIVNEVAKLRAERDAATKRADGLAADLAACVGSRDKLDVLHRALEGNFDIVLAEREKARTDLAAAQAKLARIRAFVVDRAEFRGPDSQRAASYISPFDLLPVIDAPTAAEQGGA